MSLPLLIWTMRRTGGTTLTDLLMEFSDRPRLQHEPFNWDRQLGSLNRQFATDKSTEGLRRALDAALVDGPSIKHCLEISSRPFNAVLMQAADGLGYRHVVLRRKDEVGRLLSLELATITGAWGKHGSAERYRAFKEGEREMPPLDIDKMLQHLRHCRESSAKVEEGFKRHGIEPIRIAFEDIYLDPAEGRKRVRALCEALQIVPGDPVRFEKELDTALLAKGQNSAAMFDAVPNIDEARARLSEAIAAYDSAAAAPAVSAGGVQG